MWWLHMVISRDISSACNMWVAVQEHTTKHPCAYTHFYMHTALHTHPAVLAQAFCPVITMLALFIAGLEKPSHRLISSVVMIAMGTAAASYGEVNLSYIGLLIMLSSECFEAVRLVMTQMLLTGLKLHPSM